MQLLSPSIQLTRTHIIYKHPQPRSDDPLYPDGDGRSFRNWHRDLNNFAPNHPIRGTVSIRVGYCLTDFTEPCSGVTLLVPGSHRLVEQIRIPKGSLDPADYVELPLQPGDAYLFSSSCYHFPALNFQRSPAKGILVTYAYRWWSHSHPRPADELLEKMDPIARQLFGDAPADEEQLPLRHWAREHGLPNAEVPPDAALRVNCNTMNLRVLGFKEDGEWCALCLEMDLRGYGKIFEDALKELSAAVLNQFTFAIQMDNPDLLLRKAEIKYFSLYYRLRRKAARRLHPRRIRE